VIVISAAGVGLAIVLLVAGVITSNLLFVYISIGVSVAAALLLAAGVFTRRELFIGGQDQGRALPQGTVGEKDARAAPAAAAPAAPAANKAPASTMTSAPRQAPDTVHAPSNASSTEPAAKNVMAGAGARPPGRPRPTAAFTPPESEIVFVTPGRRRFHASGCGLLVGRLTEELTRGEALEEGFSACTTCMPAGAQEGPRPAGPVRVGPAAPAPAAPARAVPAHPGPAGEETARQETARTEPAREETERAGRIETKRATPEPSPMGSAARPWPVPGDDRGAAATGTPAAGRISTFRPAEPAEQAEAEGAEAEPAEAQPTAAGPAAAGPAPAKPAKAEAADVEPAEAESPEPAQEHAAPAGSGADSDGDGELADDGDPDATVWVVRGVSRYHLSDCVLIQVVDEEDVDTMTLAEARVGGCTPCRACHID
jgi:hypothetical protein